MFGGWGVWEHPAKCQSYDTSLLSSVVEQWSCKPEVESSILSVGTTFGHTVSLFCVLYVSYILFKYTEIPLDYQPGVWRAPVILRPGGLVKRMV